jgi:hypothetical protein
MKRLGTSVVDGVVQQMERRGVQVGTVTRDGVAEAIQTGLAPGRLPSLACLIFALIG